MLNNKVVIIGCGNVGMSYAFALLNQRTKVTDIVLIDIDTERVVGEVMDLNHGLSFAPNKVNIKAGTYEDCMDAAIVCICAGAPQKQGETRLDLIHKNEKIVKDIIDNVLKTNFHGIFLIVTNPVDVLTYVAQNHSKFPVGKVIGTGTTLDTARLRFLIGDTLTINPKNIHAYVIGEHGDSEFVPWSNAFIGSTSIKEYLDEEKLESLELEVKNAAYEVIKRKKATYYGIGMSLVRITNAILNNENTILTISSYNKEHNLYIGMPSIVNQKGVVGISKMNLTQSELEKFNNTVSVIKREIEKL
ncbi:MAG: L-lactate dehydrogenase [Bacilli bacterium]|nr:L-lactate dehydrogenase [Bacilli bacterium]MDD4548003.1 L-lactate dehydrogenase [Bacilli bacterium]